jgi:glucose/arabinose dehydrogenase
MALVGHDLYVANTDAIMRFTYMDGETQIKGLGDKVADLPAGLIIIGPRTSSRTVTDCVFT